MTNVRAEVERSIRSVMESKRKISILIPYILKENAISVYLQKRSKDAKRLPDYFGFFGGGAEGNENPEEALRREMKEEISFIPEGYTHFKKYNFEQSIKEIFLLKTSISFEQKITILEGEYGRWFTEQETLSESKLIGEDKLILGEVYEFLRK